MKFTKPDEKTISRMTVFSLTTLIDTLKTQRAEIVKPFDTQIEFYERLLEQKKEQANASTPRTV